MMSHSDLLAAAKGMLNRDPDPEPAPPQAVTSPADDAGETTQPMAVVPVAPAPLAGRQMGFLDQARHQAGHTLMQVRHARHTEGGVLHRMWNGQPRSMAQAAEYRRSRRWVKPGHEGGVADKGGAAFHAVIAPPLKVIGLAFSEAGDSPLKFAVGYFGVFCLTELALCGFHHSTLAVWIAVIHVAILVVAVLALCALTGRRDDDTEPAAEIVTEPEETQ
jgi:hypothetical protein